MGVSSRAIGGSLGCVEGVSGVWGIPAHRGGSGMRNCPNRHCSSCGGGRAPSRKDRAGHSPPPHSPAPPVPGSGHPQSPQGPQHAGPAGSLINVLTKTPEPPWTAQHIPLHACFPHHSPETPREFPTWCHHQCDLTTTQDPPCHPKIPCPIAIPTSVSPATKQDTPGQPGPPCSVTPSSVSPTMTLDPLCCPEAPASCHLSSYLSTTW